MDKKGESYFYLKGMHALEWTKKFQRHLAITSHCSTMINGILETLYGLQHSKQPRLGLPNTSHLTGNSSWNYQKKRVKMIECKNTLPKSLPYLTFLIRTSDGIGN